MKTLTIDWDSYADVSRFSNMVKSRLGELNSNRVSKKERFRGVFKACLKIWEADTLKHYSALNLDSERKYYIYAHLDPTQKIAAEYNPKTTFGATLGMTHFPFYVGKGTGERWVNFNRNETHRKIRQSLGISPIALILKQELTEAEALAFEDKLIDIFGLKIFGGYLTNLDEGYHPDVRRQLYADSYSLMVQGSREHRGSTPLPSTKAVSEAILVGGLPEFDSLECRALENRE